MQINLAQCFNNQFTNTTKYTALYNNRIIDKKMKKLQKTRITIMEHGKKQTMPRAKHKSTDTDDINIRHLKHLN